MPAAAPDFRQRFLAFALARDVLRFGDFLTKAGRRTPYFFNAGLFNDGASLATLGRFYAEALMAAGVPFDMLFGPAYKGITLAASTAIALAQNGHNVPFSFNRKEAKDHGEGGDIVGAPLAGRVVIVDDVITDGGAKREAIERVRAGGDHDRLRSQGARPRSAVRGAGDHPRFRRAGRGDRHARRPAPLHRYRRRARRARAGDRRLSRAIRRAMSSALPASLVVHGLVAAALALAAPLAAAETYKWTDDKGVVHYTDKMPAEDINKAATVLDKQARPGKHIDPPLTPEQRAARDAEEKKKQALQKSQEEADRQDRALMQSFTSVDE